MSDSLQPHGTIAYQVPPSMGFSRQEYWSGLPFNIDLKFYMCVLSCLSRVQLFGTLWTVAHQAPLSMGFSRQEYPSGLPCPLAGDLPNPGTEPKYLLSPALAGRFFTTGATWEAPYHIISSVQSLSPIPTLYNPMDCSTPGFPVHHQLLELAQTHVH